MKTRENTSVSYRRRRRFAFWAPRGALHLVEVVLEDDDALLGVRVELREERGVRVGRDAGVPASHDVFAARSSGVELKRFVQAAML